MSKHHFCETSAARVAFGEKPSYPLGSRSPVGLTTHNKFYTMKPNKPALTKTRAAKTATKPAAKALSPTAAKKTPPAAAKTAKTPALLTSPRVTKAAARAGALVAANAKKALAPLVPTIAKSAKPAAPKKPKLAAKPKVTAPAAVAQAAPAPTPPQTVKTTAAPLPRVTTTIEAFIDVGFGNRLTLRGEGAAGLSWERGLTMNCIGNAEWVIALETADTPLTFKFLLNDERWSVGENYTLAPGKTGAFTPEF